MKMTNQPLRLALLGLSALLVLHPNEASAGCGGGGCGGRSTGGGGGGGGGGFNNAAYQKQKKERAERKAAREKKREILSEYMDPIDENKDGSISLKEFVDANRSHSGVSAAEEEFKQANTNGDRYLQKSEIAKMINLEAKMKKR